MDRIERAICKVLESTLKRHGFFLQKYWGYFVREQPHGLDALLVVNQGTAEGRFFTINFSFKVRHDRIELPWNSLGLIYGEEAQKETATIGLISPRPPNLPRLKVAPTSIAEDAASVAHEIEASFGQTGLPFYQRFSELQKVEDLANRQPLADLYPYSVGGPVEHRGMRSLLLAKSVNPLRYAEVREAFITLDRGMFPREKRLEMLRKVDEMEL